MTSHAYEPHLYEPLYGGERSGTVPDGLRPLLFLDVDGPLIPFGAREGADSAHPTYPPAPPAAVSPLLARLDPAQGPRLAALPYDLVWATTWEADANAWVAPRLGLPELPLVPWPEGPEGPEGPDGRDGRDGPEGSEGQDGPEGPNGQAEAAWQAGPGSAGLHWKTPALVAWAAGRPFAWVDDEIGAADRAWVAAHHAGPALLHRVDARRGLTGTDYATLAAWVG
ncbi:hypothetical protein [Streptomyces sp. NPDC093089]|uniref:hypothetical protein n=1 Tax=Streptomyces sp. NPDC093089 TaxID=3366024 RepID=UPI0037FFB97B